MDSGATNVDAARTIYTTDAKVHSLTVSRGVGGAQLVLWGCVAALISILAVTAVFVSMCFQNHTSNVGAAHEEKELIGRGRRGHPSSNAFSGVARSSASKTLTSNEPTSEASDRLSSSSLSRAGGNTTPLPGLPLCPLLIVPDGTRLACIVQNDACRRKQDLSFDIGAVPARGGAPLFRARISELGSDKPGIFIETLSGREQLAVLSTENLWRGDDRPVLAISRPWGLHYGTIQKGENGEYLVTRGESTLLVFTGDFTNHSIRVMNSSENTVATTMATSPEEYQVHMQARTDAGLVILGLLAIDKCELTPDPTRKGSSSGFSSETSREAGLQSS